MKNILFSSLVVMSLVAITGCSRADTGAKSAKCAGGKCGADKKASKCGSNESSKKCGGAK